MLLLRGEDKGSTIPFPSFDVLGKLTDKALEVGVVKGFKVGRDEVKISHLQFANDTLFLFENYLENIKNIRSILKFFTLHPDLKSNMGSTLHY